MRLKECKEESLQAFFEQYWGSSLMVISSGVYQCDQLPGFVCVTAEGEIVGLITYVDRGEEREIISLDATIEKKGIGSQLMEIVEIEAAGQGISRLKVITSNDNVNALRFYQKRGYRIIGVLQNAIDEARKIKADIPLVGYDGIPMKDEIVLQKELGAV